MRMLVHAFSTAFPGAMAQLAYRRLNTPQVRKLRDHEELCLDRSERTWKDFRGFRIPIYTWKPGATDPILLVHGWEGQAGNFADLIDRLEALGQTVVAFDAPSHGHSSRGRSNLFDFSDLVLELLRAHRPARLVSHSFGGVAVTYALHRAPDVTIDRYVMFTTPDRFQDRIDSICDQVGVSRAAADRLVARIEAETQQPVAALNVSDLFPADRVGALLVLHDRDDRVLGIEQGRRVAEANGGRLVALEGTGHFRILRTPAVLDQALSHLGLSRVTTPAVPGGAGPRTSSRTLG